jgi:hypothetical protein
MQAGRLQDTDAMFLSIHTILSLMSGKISPSHQPASFQSAGSSTCWTTA